MLNSLRHAGGNQRLHLDAKRVEDVDRVVPRLPIHEDAGVKRVHEALFSRGPGACSAAPELSAQAVEVVEAQVEKPAGIHGRDSVRVQGLQNELRERASGAAQRLITGVVNPLFFGGMAATTLFHSASHSR